jgi:mannitol-1-/sugar-/sorbitol-6-/2-deoxyglucose-6-phosphatase
MFRAAIFDMDGTLVDSESHWKQAEREVFGTVGIVVTDEIAAITAPLTPRAVTEYYYRLKPWTSPPLETMESAVVTRVGELLRGTARALPGVGELLGLCRSLEWRVGLASNSPTALCHLVLGELAITESFHAVVGVDDVALGKPDPSIYLETARRLGVEPHECLAFEDSATGVLAARAAGMSVVGVPSTRQKFAAPAVPHLALDSLAEFAREHASALWSEAASAPAARGAR